MDTPAVDSKLFDWRDLDERHGWSGLLLGNGASRGVWDDFKYQSLYEMARSERVEHRLTGADEEIFEEMGTTNFEQVLAGLAVSRVVCRALGIDASRIEERYHSIQRALFEAVSAVHVPWAPDNTEVYIRVRGALLPYEYVYSTNYDLILYWSVMSDAGTGFKDYFWGDVFDITEVEIWGKVTKLLYLHGGIHLARLPSGRTYKRKGGAAGNLLDSLEFSEPDGGVPLFITEGNSTDKLSSIYRSDYLAFAYQQFSRHDGPLVVFGQSLGNSDQHLIDAMRRWGNRRIAVSVYQTDANEIIEYKAKLRRRLPDAELLYFDSTTHPLGSAELRIED
jgi:hypothetical protein